MPTPFHVLLISGSTRSGSTNTAVLRTAAAVAPDDITTTLFDGLADLPAFNPDDDYDPLHTAVARLRAAIADADAVLFCTPEYAGALPGSFKNLLDWTVGGPEMDGQPVAWLNVSSIAAPTGGADAHASLAKVMGYINARVIEPACRRIPMTRQAVGEDGTVTEPGIRDQIRDALQALQRESRTGHHPAELEATAPGLTRSVKVAVPFHLVAGTARQRMRAGDLSH